MRYDSDPQVVRRILTDTEELQRALTHANTQERIAFEFFDLHADRVSKLLNTLGHFIELHLLNPQFSLSRFSAHHIEQKILALQKSLITFFSRLEFSDLTEKVAWNRDRFLRLQPFQDKQQLFIQLYERLVQLLETYYLERIRATHFAALLNEVVGWIEHIQIHGHHDIHAVILFSEKVARDRAVIEQRVEAVREICTLLQERSFLWQTPDAPNRTAEKVAFVFSRLYSPYLLELYEALLDDLSIVAISSTDYHAFERYCQENDIDVYEEYHDVIKTYLREYVTQIKGDIPGTLQVLKLANIIVNADLIHRQYLDFDVPEEALGEHLSTDIRLLEQAIQQLKAPYPDLAQQYLPTLQKIKKFKGEIMKPAIKVYGQYLHNPKEFFQQLSQKLTAWIPILDSAMACLEPEDDLYQKCLEVKTQMDQFMLNDVGRG